MWIGIALQWNHRQDDLGARVEAARIATRLQEALSDSHRRAAGISGLLLQLQEDGAALPGRAALEAGLRGGLTGPAADLDGLQVLDGAGRRGLAVGQPVEVPEAALRSAALPALLWHQDQLLLAGRLAGGTLPADTFYVGTLRPGTLADALRGEPGFVALRLADGALVAVIQDSVRLLQRNAALPEADAATPSLAGPPADRLMMPLPFGGAEVVLEGRAGHGLRRTLLLGGAVLAGLQLLAVLLLLPGQAGPAAEDQARNPDPAHDRALPGIRDMPGAPPATLFHAALFPDRSLRFTGLSENAEELTGLPRAELTRPGAWRERVHPADLPALERHLDALRRDGESSVEYRFRHADGRTIWLREQARITAAGPHGGADAMGSLADISGEWLPDARAMAGAKLATLGRMASALAHEMTQPISVMMLAAENGLDAHDTMRAEAAPVMAAKLGRILEQTRRAQALVERLRMFGRGQDGQPGAVDLDSAVEGALLLCSGVLERARVAVEVRVPHGLPPVAADPVMLEQVIVNLLLNARDALLRMPDGARALTLRARALPGDQVELQVADTGPGLSPEAMAHLFEPFFTTKGSGQGMGLGLPQCHGIVRSFGGEITGENAGRGAVFTIRLPALGPGASDRS